MQRCRGIGPPSSIPSSGLCFCWPPTTLSDYVVIQLLQHSLGLTRPTYTHHLAGFARHDLDNCPQFQGLADYPPYTKCTDNGRVEPGSIGKGLMPHAL